MYNISETEIIQIDYLPFVMEVVKSRELFPKCQKTASQIATVLRTSLYRAYFKVYTSYI
jgi:hypothetical protein